MKTKFGFYIGLMLMVGITACNEDNEGPTLQDSKVSFNNNLIFEDADGIKTIPIKLSRKATVDGEIVIETNSSFSASFESTPAIDNNEITVPIQKGDSSAQFTIQLKDDVLISNEIEYEFTIKNVTSGFTIDEKDSLLVQFPSTGSTESVSVEFISNSIEILENAAEGINISMKLSSKTTRAGTITIKIEDQNDLASFSPEYNVNKLITFEVASNKEQVDFTISPKDNSLLHGNKQLKVNIIEATGGVTLGSTQLLEVNIVDDELKGKPKMYHTTSAIWESKNTFEYNENSQVSKVIWENLTLNTQSGIKTYFYSENSLIERVNFSENHDEYFYIENNKIMRSEVIKNGVKTAYSNYDYDSQDNVGAKETYDLQESGEFIKSFVYIYLYFTDNNIYKQLTYIPIGENEDDFELISTRTFDQYLEKDNLFPVYEVIPGKSTQNKLPSTYSVEENGSNLSYQFSYEWDANGKMIKRTVTGPASETTVYSYY